MPASTPLPLRLHGLQHKDVAAELLEKLLKDELKVRSKDNLMQSQEECLCGARGPTGCTATDPR